MNVTNDNLETNKVKISTKKYIFGIDGLRAIAVLGVILYHLVPQSIPGGFLGVPLFFVISGYLMTDILLKQFERTSKINLKNFYYRRFKRLYPPLILLLVITGAVYNFINRNFLLNFKAVVASSLLNVNNIWQIQNGQSYFDNFATESSFIHLWSLSIEGQFYIFWPIVFGLLLFLVRDYRKIGFVLMGTAIVSALLMAILYSPESINRVYYGSDTRLFSILLGSLVALMVRDEALSEDFSRFKYKKITFFALIVSLIGSMFVLVDSSAFIYFGGMFIYSLLASVCLFMIVMDDGLSKALSNPIIYWIGTRSYDIYLWQLPVLVYYAHVNSIDGTKMFSHTMIQLLIIGIISELSYRMIQVLKHKEHWISLIHAAQEKSRYGRTRLTVVTLIVASFIFGLIASPSGKAESALALQERLESNLALLNQESSEEVQETETTQESTQESSSIESSTTESTVDDMMFEERRTSLTNEELEKASQIKISAIGDSVLLSVSPEFQETFTNSYINAEVGRQLEDSPPLFNMLADQNLLGDVVVISLGTNGFFDEEDLDQIMETIGDKPTFLVNTLVDRVWQASVNENLEKASRKYKNAYLVDWKQYAQGHPEWFYEDGVHLLPDGAQEFSDFIAKTVIETLDQ